MLKSERECMVCCKQDSWCRIYGKDDFNNMVITKVTQTRTLATLTTKHRVLSCNWWFQHQIDQKTRCQTPPYNINTTLQGVYWLDREVICWTDIGLVLQSQTGSTFHAWVHQESANKVSAQTPWNRVSHNINHTPCPATIWDSTTVLNPGRHLAPCWPTGQKIHPTSNRNTPVLCTCHLQYHVNSAQCNYGWTSGTHLKNIKKHQTINRFYHSTRQDGDNIQSKWHDSGHTQQCIISKCPKSTKSSWRALFSLRQWKIPLNNGAIHNIAKAIRAGISSTVKAKLGAMFINAR